MPGKSYSYLTQNNGIEIGSAIGGIVSEERPPTEIAAPITTQNGEILCGNGSQGAGGRQLEGLLLSDLLFDVEVRPLHQRHDGDERGDAQVQGW